MSNVNKLFHAAFAVAFVVISAGCDWIPGPGHPVVFQGETVTSSGDATLSVENGVLVVGNLDGTNEGGFSVQGDILRLDVETDSIPTGGTQRRFGVSVRDGNGDAIAEMFIEGISQPSLGGGPYSNLRFAFADADGVQYVRIRYRLGGDIVSEIDTLYVGQGSLDASLLAEGSAGFVEGVAGSVHVLRGPDGRYTVVSDAEGGNDSFQGQCPFFIFPPGGRSTVCADWVEVTPLDGAVRSATSTAVTARGVGEFTVRSLDVTRSQAQ